MSGARRTVNRGIDGTPEVVPCGRDFAHHVGHWHRPEDERSFVWCEGRTAVEITVRLVTDRSLVGVEGALDALGALANVMDVQAEDGLWTHGVPGDYADDNEHLAGFASVTTRVTVVEP